jgi:choline-glycine betaine transporter
VVVRPRRTAPAIHDKVLASPIATIDRNGGNMHVHPLYIPLAAFVMVVLIVLITSMTKMREKELSAHQQLRQQEMEHERKMKELEVEKAKIELEKAKASQPTGKATG